MNRLAQCCRAGRSTSYRWYELVKICMVYIQVDLLNKEKDYIATPKSFLISSMTNVDSREPSMGS